MWTAVRTSMARRMTAPAGAAQRWLATKTEAELAMQKSLEAQLEASHVKVVDVSGGCGSMYDVEVVSPRFQGLTRVKQHRLVNEALKAEIKDMHGLTIRTMTPEQYASKQ